LRIKEKKTRRTLQEHDNDDDDDQKELIEDLRHRLHVEFNFDLCPENLILAYFKLQNVMLVLSKIPM